ncbi:hypothetical protein BV898_10803 [Hypsibius exemplaris]|uniref:Reverse transcriptase domain-containing protein n=1 Tax=Hypsibius exemplaris TaxID=2072580 RepID=A0A1W0WIK7_HYPEX|nr:hypothetical protein BV898_10803 [Hypsibius exemplaris]
MDDLYDSFTGRFEERKSQERTSYPHPPTVEEQKALNNAFPMEISADMISNVARRIRIDTSTGPDHVIMRIVKQKEVAAVLAVIDTIMLQWSYTPAKYRHYRTVLVPKGSNGKDRRPITICSVLRRVVKRVLDRYFKSFTSVSARQYGFTSSPGVHVASFIIGGCLQHAKTTKSDICVVMLDVKLVNRARSLLLEIGFHVNTGKSKAIVLQKGIQSSAPLDLGDGTIIPVSLPGEKNRYLGTTITDQPAFDHEIIIRSLTDSLEKLARSNLLHSDQKLNIINQFIWPQLIFPLQTAPLNTFPNGFLQAVDKVVRSTVKEIVRFPTDIPNSFFYAPRKFKSLGVMNAEKEGSFQHVNICFGLEKDGEPLVLVV